MRWSRRNKDDYYEDWHRWFAWHPVCVGRSVSGDKRMVWLVWVERKFDDCLHESGWYRESGSEIKCYFDYSAPEGG